MELVKYYIYKDELTAAKRAYDKMNKEHICPGCMDKFDFYHAYSMIDPETRIAFYGHKYCLGIVRARFDRLKERYGVEKVVEKYGLIEQ